MDKTDMALRSLASGQAAITVMLHMHPCHQDCAGQGLFPLLAAEGAKHTVVSSCIDAPSQRCRCCGFCCRMRRGLVHFRVCPCMLVLIVLTCVPDYIIKICCSLTHLRCLCWALQPPNCSLCCPGIWSILDVSGGPRHGSWWWFPTHLITSTDLLLLDPSALPVLGPAATKVLPLLPWHVVPLDVSGGPQHGSRWWFPTHLITSNRSAAP